MYVYSNGLSQPKPSSLRPHTPFPARHQPSFLFISAEFPPHQPHPPHLSLASFAISLALFLSDSHRPSPRSRGSSMRAIPARFPVLARYYTPPTSRRPAVMAAVTESIKVVLMRPSTILATAAYYPLLVLHRRSHRRVALSHRVLLPLLLPRSPLSFLPTIAIISVSPFRSSTLFPSYFHRTHKTLPRTSKSANSRSCVSSPRIEGATYPVASILPLSLFHYTRTTGHPPRNYP